MQSVSTVESNIQATVEPGSASSVVPLPALQMMLDSEQLRRLGHVVAEAIGVSSRARPVWVDKHGLAAHSTWGVSKIEKLSAENRLPCKVRHGKKVMFHLPTFDEWALAGFPTDFDPS